MRKKYLAITMGIMMGVSLMAGCGTTADNAGSATEESLAGQTVYGEISAIDGDTVTIEVGTETEEAENMLSGDQQAPTGDAGEGQQNEDAASDDTDTENADTESADEGADSSDTADSAAGEENNGNAPEQPSGDASDSSTQEQPSGDMQMSADDLLDLTGEEQTITITDDTVISRQMMGGMQMGQGGQMSSGQAPDGQGQAPSGDSSSDSSDGDSQTPPEQPSGDAGSSDSSDGDSQTPPEQPSGDAGSSDSSDSSQTPPEQPSGDAGSSDSSDSSQTPPEMPSGEAGSSDSSDNSQTPPEQPSGDAGSSDSSDDSTDSSAEEAPSDANVPDMSSQTLSVDDLSVGDIISITYDEDGNVSEITVLFSDSDASGMTGGGQDSAAVTDYTAVNEYSEDTEVNGETISSTGTDENAVLVKNGANVTIADSTITRDSDDSTGGDNSSFYGVGAAVLTTDGNTYIKNSKITTDAKGGAGVFSYGDGTTYVADTTITTTQDTSGGIHAAGGGTLYAWDLTVDTSGESSAAIRSDRGGGTMVVDGGTYTSNGTGSPAVYSTADITVNDATLTSNTSEAVCIEGLNSLRLYDCDLTGNMQDNVQNDCTWNVILYQSMSGDSEEGNSTFEMSGGSITAKNGGMFYTTNTESTFILNDVDITYADDNPFFLKCTGNSNQRGWGDSGSNGADCNFTGIDQTMTGNVIWDSISQLDFYMTEGSTLTGAIEDDESNAGDGGNGYCNLYISDDSTWIVTGNSTLTSLQNAGTIQDKEGKTVTIKGTDGTVYVQGTSSYTVTVDSYSTTADLSGASSVGTFSDYAVEKPSQLS